jgi:hypothetical protein
VVLQEAALDEPAAFARQLLEPQHALLGAHEPRERAHERAAAARVQPPADAAAAHGGAQHVGLSAPRKRFELRERRRQQVRRLALARVAPPPLAVRARERFVGEEGRLKEQARDGVGGRRPVAAALLERGPRRATHARVLLPPPRGRR